MSSPLDATQLIAHRGYQRHYPENSPLAIRQAIACGARRIEIDVQFSADGVAVLYHDETLERVSGCNGKLQDLPWQQLQTLPAGEAGRFGQRFADIRIAPLQALVEILQQHPEVQALVELKEDAVRDVGASHCLAILRQTLAPVLEQCVLISFAIDALRAAREHGFTRLGAVLRDWSLRHDIAGALQAEMIICNYKRIPTTENIYMPQCAVALYEVDDIALAQALLQRGADFIETFAIGEMLGSSAVNSHAPC